MSDTSQQFEMMALDDFEELLADKPRNERWELIGGEALAMSPAPSFRHQEIVSELTAQLVVHLRGKPCRALPDEFGKAERADRLLHIVRPPLRRQERFW